MTKVTDILNSTPIPGPQKTQKQKTGMFQQNLDAARAKRQATETSPGSMAPLGELTSTTFPTISTPSSGIANKTNGLLDLLDAYARDIENPNKTLKEIEPLIVSIQKKAYQLMEEADKIIPDHAELKRIAEECAVTANVEYIKFYRGDYT